MLEQPNTLQLHVWLDDVSATRTLGQVCSSRDLRDLRARGCPTVP